MTFMCRWALSAILPSQSAAVLERPEIEILHFLNQNTVYHHSRSAFD